MTSTIVAEEVPPLCHPLGPNNKLVFSPGIVTGTPAPTSARDSVGAKSPLTGGIKESNAGSAWGADLAKLRIRALILEGKPEEVNNYWGILIGWDAKAEQPKVEFLEANEYVGKPLPEVFPIVFERFGEKISIGGVGLAGEYGYANSGIVFNDIDQRSTRYAGRKKMTEALQTHDITKPKGGLNTYGTAVLTTS